MTKRIACCLILLILFFNAYPLTSVNALSDRSLYGDALFLENNRNTGQPYVRGTQNANDCDIWVQKRLEAVGVRIRDLWGNAYEQTVATDLQNVSDQSFANPKEGKADHKLSTKPSEGWNIFFEKQPDQDFSHVGLIYKATDDGQASSNYWAWHQGWNQKPLNKRPGTCGKKANRKPVDKVKACSCHYYSARYTYDSLKGCEGFEGKIAGARKGTQFKYYPFKTSVYVSPGGSDKNSGDRYFPVRSVQFGVALAAENYATNVFVERGIYTDGQGLNTAGNGLKIDGTRFNKKPGGKGRANTRYGMKLYGGWDAKTNNKAGRSVLVSGSDEHPIIEIADSSDVVLNGFDISGGRKGGIYLLKTTNSMLSDCAIYGNSGGAITIQQGGNNKLEKTVRIEDNTAVAETAGISLYQTNDNRISCELRHNKGQKQTGAIHLLESRRNTIDGVISGNIGCGGVVIGCGGDDNKISAEVTFNTSAGGLGGGISIDGGSGNTILGLVAGNSGAIHGGGVDINSWGGSKSTANVISGVIKNNSAEVGGGVNIENEGATENLLTGQVTGNVAKCGGGVRIFCSSGNKIRAAIAGNSATGDPNWGPYNGGGLWCNNRNNDIDEGLITGNVNADNQPDNIRYA